MSTERRPLPFIPLGDERFLRTTPENMQRARSLLEERRERGAARVEGPPPYIRQIVLKIFNLCNLACDYCYEYPSDDLSWQKRPGKMSQERVLRTVGGFASYARFRKLEVADVILHGGEPLLVGPQGLRAIAEATRQGFDEHAPQTKVRIGAQTNGLRLTEPMLEVMGEYDISFGVSLDGDQETHDKHRKGKRGEPSYAQVREKIDLVNSDPESRRLFSGLLCVIDVESNPYAVFEALMECQPKTLDFLLPYGTWDELPPKGGRTDAQYGRWLTKIFDVWWREGRAYNGQPVNIRLFDQVVSLLRGAGGGTDTVGPYAGGEVIVRTDGSLELLDFLGVAGLDKVQTGMNVDTHTFEDMERFLLAAGQLGRKSVAAMCQGCDLLPVCAGGPLPTRFSKDFGFENTSVFCSDLQYLIRHIAQALTVEAAEDISVRMRQNYTDEFLRRKGRLSGWLPA